MIRRPLLTLLVGLATVVAATSALAAHSVPESWQALTRQVDGGQVASALVVPKKNEVRVRLKDGSHFTATYPSGGEPAAISSLRSHGATVQVHKAAAGSSGHVRYRYIALAILALGALAALGYYLLRGRPAARSGQAAPGAPVAPADPHAPPSTAAHPAAGRPEAPPPPERT